MNEVIITLLSAGVFTSLVTGIFSLIVTVKNNKTLKYLEQEKEANQKQGQLYKMIFSAREELLSALPPETQVHVSSSVLEKFSSDYFEKLQKFIPSCIDSQRIIWTHFNKYRPYFSDEECNNFNELNDKIVKLAKKRDEYLEIISDVKSKNPDWMNQIDNYPNESLNEELKHGLELSKSYPALLTDIIITTSNLEQWYFSLLEKYIRSYMK